MLIHLNGLSGYLFLYNVHNDNWHYKFMYAYINANSSEWSFWLPADNAGGTQLKVTQFGQAYIRGCFHYLTS